MDAEPYTVVIKATAEAAGEYVNTAALTAANQAAPVEASATVTVTVRACRGLPAPGGLPAAGSSCCSRAAPAAARKRVLAVCGAFPRPSAPSAATSLPSALTSLPLRCLPRPRLRPSQVPGTPTLALTKTADPVVVVGQNFTYTLLATASGATVSGVTLTDSLPAGVVALAVEPKPGARVQGRSLVSAACGPRGLQAAALRAGLAPGLSQADPSCRPGAAPAPTECQLDTVANAVTCNWEALQVGETVPVVITAVAASTGEVVNTAGAPAPWARTAGLLAAAPPLRFRLPLAWPQPHPKRTHACRPAPQS